MNRTISRYVPENSRTVERDGLPGIVYIYTSKTDGRPAAISYTGKSGKPTWHYRFSNEEQRDKRIDEFFEGIARQENYKLARKAEKASFKHGFQVGDILYSSWGYDQTNIEYYQITAVTEKTVTFREIFQEAKAEGFMTGTCSPKINEFINDKEFTRTVRPSSAGEKGAVEFAEHKGSYQKSLWAWDGKPKHFSSYA